jgi:hypothetical protein
VKIARKMAIKTSFGPISGHWEGCQTLAIWHLSQ